MLKRIGTPLIVTLHWQWFMAAETPLCNQAIIIGSLYDDECFDAEPTCGPHQLAPSQKMWPDFAC